MRDLEQAREFIETRYRKSYAENGFGLYAVELKKEFFTLVDTRVSAGLENTLVDTRVSAGLENVPIGICGFVKREELPDADIGFAFLQQFRKKVSLSNRLLL